MLVTQPQNFQDAQPICPYPVRITAMIKSMVWSSDFKATSWPSSESGRYVTMSITLPPDVGFKPKNTPISVIKHPRCLPRSQDVM